MNKIIKKIKRLGIISLVICLNANAYAAIVSDNDGSSFITKAEFDSLKNTFQSQISAYNNGIDAKVDGAIAAYLSGISTEAKIQVVNDYYVLQSSNNVTMQFSNFTFPNNYYTGDFKANFAVNVYCDGFPKTWSTWSGNTDASYNTTDNSLYNLIDDTIVTNKNIYAGTVKDYVTNNINIYGSWMEGSATGSCKFGSTNSTSGNYRPTYSYTAMSTSVDPKSDVQYVSCKPSTSGWNTVYTYYTNTFTYNKKTPTTRYALLASNVLSTSGSNFLKQSYRDISKIKYYTTQSKTYPLNKGATASNPATSLSWTDSPPIFTPYYESVIPSNLYNYYTKLKLTSGIKFFTAPESGTIKFKIKPSNSNAQTYGYLAIKDSEFGNSTGENGVNIKVNGASAVKRYRYTNNTEITVTIDVVKGKDYYIKLSPYATTNDYYVYVSNSNMQETLLLEVSQ